MDDRLDREMGGQNTDNSAFSSQPPGQDPGEAQGIPPGALIPPDFPPGMQGLLPPPSLATQPPIELAAVDEKPQGQPGAMDLFRGSLVALSANLSPGIGLRFLAWQAHHLGLLYSQDDQGTWSPRYPLDTQFSMYLEDATSRDALEDAGRPDERRQYNFTALHIDGLLPMVQAETDAHREEIASDLRKSWARKLKALGVPQAKIEQALA